MQTCVRGGYMRHAHSVNELGRTGGRKSCSGLSTVNKDQIAERGARMARRDDREYREYLREEQRSQPGCPAREVVLDHRGPATQFLISTTVLALRWVWIISG